MFDFSFLHYQTLQDLFVASYTQRCIFEVIVQLRYWLESLTRNLQKNIPTRNLQKNIHNFLSVPSGVQTPIVKTCLSCSCHSYQRMVKEHLLQRQFQIVDVTFKVLSLKNIKTSKRLVADCVVLLRSIKRTWYHRFELRKTHRDNQRRKTVSRLLQRTDFRKKKKYPNER